MKEGKIIVIPIKNIKKETYISAALILIMAVLAFMNLGNRYLSIDESVNAMLGRNILKFGYPAAWDGQNLITSRNGNELSDKLVFMQSNWLSFYLSAFGQLINIMLNGDALGSVVCMRAVFVLVGIVGAIYFYFLTRRLTNNASISIIALCLYTLSVQVLLYIRVTYYLSPALTFTIMTVYFYIKYMEKLNVLNWIGFTFSSILLFHSLYIFFFIAVLVLGLSYILFDRKRSNFPGIALSLSCIAVLTLPWYIYNRMTLNQAGIIGFTGVEYFWQLILGYLWQIHTYFFPFIPLILIYLFYTYITSRKKKNKNFVAKRSHLDNTPDWINITYRDNKIFTMPKPGKRFSIVETRNKFIIVGYVICNLLIVSLFDNLLERKWLIISIPFLYILNSYIVNYLYKKDRVFGLTILCLIIFTNIINISPYIAIKESNLNPKIVESFIKSPVPFFSSTKIGYSNKKAGLSEFLNNKCNVTSYFIDFLEEISNEYSDADKGMINFLQKYGNKNDKVYVVGYQYETIAYYTGMTVVNRLNPSWKAFPSEYKNYPNASRYEYLTKYPIEQCDWIIERKIDEPKYLNGKLPVWYDEDFFERFYINYPEADPWFEIWAHTFFTDKSYPGFYIFRNRKTTNEISAEHIIEEEQLK